MAGYDAFISYSHTKDKPIAAALQSVAQKLGKPWYRRRALRVFRDDTSLSATPSLWPSIEQALGQSRYLMLLASPEAATSPWVNKEVAYWLDHNDADTLLIGVTDGELVWDSSVGDFRWCDSPPLPPVLTGRFATEPKWVDLRAYRDGANPRDAKFIELAADFAAAIRGIPKEDLLSQEVRQQRRALTLAWSAAVLLLVLAGMSTWQWIETTQSKRLALAEAARAEQNFNAAKSTIDAVIFDLALGLRDVEGMRVATVGRILGRAEAAVGNLASRIANDPEVRRSQGEMFNLFSDTYSLLGDKNLALEYARKATDLTRSLAAENPGNSQWQRDVVASLVRLGDALLAQGDLMGALNAHREGEKIARMLAAKEPTNTSWQHSLFIALHRMGYVLEIQRDLAGALIAYIESFEIASALLAREPGALQWQLSVLALGGKVADVRQLQGDLEGALETYRQSLDFRRAFAANEPDNTQRQRDVSITLEKIGDLLRTTADLNGALSAYREGLDIARTLATKDPGNMLWQRDISVKLERIGLVLRSQGDLAAALVAYRETLTIRRAIVAKDPSNSQSQTDVAVSLVNLARVGEDQRTQLSEALAILAQLDQQGRLPTAQKKWIKAIEADLSRLTQSGAK